MTRQRFQKLLKEEIQVVTIGDCTEVWLGDRTIYALHDGGKCVRRARAYAATLRKTLLRLFDEAEKEGK